MKETNEERVLREKVQGILSKGLHETIKTPMSGGVKRHDFTLINLHNLRLIYDFSMTDKERRSLKSYIKTEHRGGSGDVTIELINYGSTFKVTDFMGANLQIKKNSIEVRYLKGKDRWHLIEHGDKGAQQYMNLILTPNNECKYIINEWMLRFGGHSKLQLLNTYHHAKGMGDNVITKIPKHMKFHNNLLQKEYNLPVIEWHKTSAVMNHLTNLGVMELSPALGKAICMLSDNIMYMQPFRALKLLTKSPHEVLDNKEYHPLMNMLSDQEKEDIWQYWFDCVDLGISDINGRRL